MGIPAFLICNAAFGQQQADFFEKHVRPVLATNCFPCHSKAHMGGLRLDSGEHLMKGGQDGPVVVLLSTYDEDEFDLEGCGASAYVAKAVFGPDRLTEVWSASRR